MCVQRSAGCSSDSSHMEAPHSTLSVRVNSGMKVFKKCTRTYFTGHFTVRFWIKPFFKYPKHHSQHDSETSTVLNAHQSINQPKHESKSSIILLSWDTQNTTAWAPWFTLSWKAVKHGPAHTGSYMFVCVCLVHSDLLTSRFL